MNEEALSIDLPTTQDMRNLKVWLKREFEVSRQEKLDELAERSNRAILILGDV